MDVPVIALALALLALVLLRFRRNLVATMVRLRRRNPFTDITQRLLPRHGNGVTWEEARAHGLNSDTFVVEQREGDERIGLDGDQADQIASIMRTRGVGFDEARYQLVRQQMIANGVDPDTGLPIDANLVTFDG